ncbi:hypothetical protein [Priestia megaterium]|uniref:hypothetical protein n=1 Tax=Priestia megaterium TaxID=1404 RepID=UPI00300A01FE
MKKEKENAEFLKGYLEQNRELNELLEALEGLQDYKDIDVNKNDSHKTNTKK